MQRQTDAYFLTASDGDPLHPAGGGTFGGSTEFVGGPTANPLNAWTHVAVTYDLATIRLYVNGTQVATHPATGSIQTTTNPLWIGGNQPYGEYFQGLIDEARVYNRPLTQPEIQTDMNNPVTPTAPDTTPPTAPTGLAAAPAGAGQINLNWTASSDNVGVSEYRVERCQGAGCTNFSQVGTPVGASYNDAGLSASTTYRYQVRATDAAGNLSAYSAIAEATTGTAPPTPSGLVGAWAFGEGVGTTTVDASGNGNTGTITAATWSTQGRAGNALSFNGTNSVVRVPSSASLNLTTGMTLSAWIRPAVSQSGWRTILQRQSEAYFLNASFDSPGRPAGGGTIGGDVPYIGGSTVNPVNTWTYVALTYDGGTLRLYVNGTQAASRATGGTVQTTTNPLWIGGNQPYGEYFNGLIDEARVYNRALSQAEVQNDMNTSVNPFAP
jgi:hypothetical protein